MDTEGLSREYESGVADVVAHLAGPEVTVQRNVYLPGRKSQQRRQIDILATGRMFGLANATLVIDCKRYNKRLDVNDVGSFVSTLEDVGATCGWLISTKGASEAAKELAKASRGVGTEIFSLEELMRWVPPGTRHITLGVPAQHFEKAQVISRKAGFRVRPELELQEASANDGEVLFRAFRHYGRDEHEQHRADTEDLKERLVAAGIVEIREAGGGVIVGGGTPAHRWLKVTLAGHETEINVMVATEEDIARELDMVASFFPNGAELREQLDVVRPEVWPIPGLFHERLYGEA